MSTRLTLSVGCHRLRLDDVRGKLGRGREDLVMQGLEKKLQVVDAAAFPPVLVTAGLLDDRVPVWMPAKWVAALRAVAGRQCAVHLNVYPGGHFLTQEEEQGLDALETAFVLQSMELAASRHHHK